MLCTVSDARVYARVARVLMVGVAFLAATLWGGGDTASRSASRGYFVAGGGRYCLEVYADAGVTQPASLEFLRISSLDAAGASTKILWSGERGPMFDASVHSPLLSIADAGADGWAIATWVHGGGSRRLHIWSSVSGPLSDLESLDPQSTGVTAIERIEMGGQVLEDLVNPELVVWEGSTYIIGESPRLNSYGEIWRASLPPHPDQNSIGLHPLARSAGAAPLAAQRICQGANPKLAVTQAQAILVVRKAPRSKQEAALQFYRSADFTEWSVDEQLSDGVRSHASFAVMDYGGFLYIATTQGAELDIQIHRRGPVDSTWTHMESNGTVMRRLRSSEEPLWLLRSNTGGDPALVFTNAEGDLIFDPL